MSLKIAIPDTEKCTTLQALKVLNETKHIKYMTQALIAGEAQIKPTKIRAILVDLIEHKYITQYLANESVNNPRYYYTITPAGEEYLEEQLTV